MKTGPLLKYIEKLERDRLVEVSGSKFEGQQKSNTIAKIKNEIAVAKTILNEKLFEKVKDE